MNNRDSQMVVRRFFLALDTLKGNGTIRGRQTFTRKYGINRWNMGTLEKEPSRDIFQVSWLTYLVRDYGISATWLLTGEGDFYASISINKTANKPQVSKDKSIKD